MNDDQYNVFLVKRAIISILIIATTLILLDLYLPLKMILGGEKLTFMEVVSYLDIRDQLSSAVTFGMLAVRLYVRKEEANTNLGNSK